MAEIAGIALGAASLTASLKTCIEAFDFIRSLQDQKKDHIVLGIRLTAQQGRLVAWAEHFGLAGDLEDDYLDYEAIKTRVRTDKVLEILQTIRDMLEEASKIQHKYGAQHSQTAEPKERNSGLDKLVSAFSLGGAKVMS